MVEAVTGKIEAPILNSNFSELDSKLESVNAGPGGYFETLEQLKVAYPQGSDRFFVVKDSGVSYTYWWKNGAWNKGDVFQPQSISDGGVTRVKIADEAVSRSKTIFYKKTPGNLIDIDNCVVGGYYSGVNGKWSLDPTLKTTEFIKVTAGQRIVRDFFTHIAFFNLSKTFISGITDISVKSFIIPNGVSLMTVAMNVNGLHDEGVYIVSDAEFYERPKKQLVKYSDDKLILTPENISNEQILNKESALFIEQNATANLFNINDENLQKNQVITMSGVWSATADYSTSGFIECKPGDVFEMPSAASFYLFSASKAFIQTVAASNKKITIPDNTDIKYVRFAILNSLIESAVITKNQDMPSNFVPFKEFILDKEIKVRASSIVGDVVFKKKYLHIFGDSITTRDYASEPYWDVINKSSNSLSITVNPRSGSRIAIKEDRTDSLIERYKTIPDGKDAVVVFMGTNDAADNTPIGTLNDGSETTLKGALSLIIDYWQSNYPKTRIGFITPIRRGNVNDVKMKTYSEAIIEVLESNGVPYFNGLELGGLNPYNSSVKTNLMPDGIHPNNDGHLYLLPRLTSFLEML